MREPNGKREGSTAENEVSHRYKGTTSTPITNAHLYQFTGAVDRYVCMYVYSPEQLCMQEFNAVEAHSCYVDSVKEAEA